MIDTVKIRVRSGRGGNGSASYRREKYIPKGGPDGGDGGDGGSVYIVADPQRNTLQHFQGVKEFVAENGSDGSRQKMFGKKGEDIEVAVPLGTIIWELVPQSQGDEPTKRRLGEVLSEDDRFVVARGGLGGRGNVHFKSSTNTTPLQYEQGGESQEKELFLELKLLADIGLVGFPNAGKSTLLAAFTKARPKIANYPFTTLSPHLGVLDVQTPDGPAQYVMADIPGLIEQASEGKGLGHEFLRHIERCRLLLFVLFLEDDALYSNDVTPEEAASRLLEQYRVLRRELENYNPELAQRPSLIALNKSDVMSPEVQEAAATALRQEAALGDIAPLIISGATHEGLDQLSTVLAQKLAMLPKTLPHAAEEGEEEEENLPVFSPDSGPNKPTVAYKERP